MVSHLRRIFGMRMLVTLGVLQKAIIIGGGLWVIGSLFGTAPLLFLVLGLHMAQMDPVAMAALADKR